MELNYKPVTSMVKPSEIEFGVTTVYMRKDISSEEKSLDNGSTVTVWTYQEAQMSLKEFENYSKLAPHNLDNNQLLIMDAIADLYDAITNLH